MNFSPVGNSDNFVDSGSIEFPSISQRDSMFHHTDYDYSCAHWDGLCVGERSTAIYTDNTTLHYKCDQTSDLWQQLELVSELESDLRDTAD